MIPKNGSNWLISHSRLEIGNLLGMLSFKIDNKFHFRITNYATTSTEESVLIIGGITNGSPGTNGRIISTIAEYKNGSWKNVGNLAQARDSHSAITLGSVTMIVGGAPNSGSS